MVHVKIGEDKYVDDKLTYTKHCVDVRIGKEIRRFHSQDIKEVSFL